MSAAHTVPDVGADLRVWEPRAGADSVVVALHGIGDPVGGFVTMSALAASMPRTRFLFPVAPCRRIAARGGAFLHAWYDLPYEGSDRDSERSEGIDDARAALEALLAARAADVPRRRVFLAGFSQGGATALYTALQGGALGGTLTFGAYLPRPDAIRPSAASRGGAFLLLHGTRDDAVPPWLADDACERIDGMGGRAVVVRYPGVGHVVTPRMLDDGAAWLRARMRDCLDP